MLIQRKKSIKVSNQKQKESRPSSSNVKHLESILAINFLSSLNHSSTIKNPYKRQIESAMTMDTKRPLTSAFKENRKPNFFLRRPKLKVRSSRTNQLNPLKKDPFNKLKSFRIQSFFEKDKDQEEKTKRSAHIRRRIIRSAYESVGKSEMNKGESYIPQRRSFQNVVKRLIPFNRLFPTKRNIEPALPKKFVLKKKIKEKLFGKTKKKKRRACSAKPVYYAPLTKNIEHLYQRKEMCKKCNWIKKR